MMSQIARSYTALICILVLDKFLITLLAVGCLAGGSGCLMILYWNVLHKGSSGFLKTKKNS
jgi:hypothetical protein